ncbi:MAG: bifunctional methylenetetrahydrofolate dehydrogenase/methenyltetrahydrofolate cyclohydrolase FolD [Magnetococcales bacterium]|nr:bifunctional methylenetetrahydrofolate dehydrogenase/methenyltetrahydrofolate cyclohydrolase FolD [Magnetococcales bacterium]MBF0322535.1 bifunctional methylenetetrahydrofolate dehydrogenase/methenyltetrahydrofolate cyclohydrolase FolD [Magnetococcales bacterium]
MATIIDGKEIARQIREDLKKEIDLLQQRHRVQPGLAVVLVGHDPASLVYVRNKKRACEEVGIRSFSHELVAGTHEGELLELIDRLNQDPAVHGILVQLPLPRQIRSQVVLEHISPNKDADGFHPFNVGRLVTGNPLFRPCTPWGIMELLRVSGLDPAGRHAVVVGRSNIVGKPVAMMLLAAHATVTICHSRTPDLAAIVRQADILVAAVGQAHLIPGTWLKEGVVVIDVGMNRTPEGQLCGDVDFASAHSRAAAITPVPGGVGPMTIAMLLKNTVAGVQAHIR